MIGLFVFVLPLLAIVILSITKMITLSTCLLFWGLELAVWTGITSLTKSGDDKRGVVAFPFAILLGAVVAKYMGF